jgi:3-oxoadipate enol-lactonase
MLTIERGSGRPLVFVPGLQGRWEYMAPAIDALAQSNRVITFPLCDEPSAEAPFDPRGGFASYAAQIEDVLDLKDIDRAVICGISFGGLIALRFAAECPSRVSALVLASTPGPSFRLKRRHRLYARLPWLFGPLFAAESPSRLKMEVKAALPDEAERRAFMRKQLLTFREAPLSVSRMAGRALLIESYDRAADAARVICPTLVVHGEPSLDFVVDANETANYSHLIKDARAVMIEETGHLGSITKPRQFATVVGTFLDTALTDSHNSAA